MPVCLPRSLLRRHLLLVAKTRRGSPPSSCASSATSWRRPLTRRAGPAALRRPGRPAPRPGPAALGLVPPDRRDGAVFLDVAEAEHPFGLNLLDAALFRDRDKAVANACHLPARVRRLLGPRMEIAFRVALMALYEANERLCATGPGRPARQFTVLDVPALLAEPPFQRSVCAWCATR